MNLKDFDDIVDRVRSRPVRTLIGTLAIILIVGFGAFLTAYFGQKGREAATPETAIILSEKTVSVHGKASSADGQFSFELKNVENSLDTVKVLLVAPGGFRKEWQQGIGRKTFSYRSQEYFVDILDMINDGLRVTKVKLTAAKRL